MTITKDALREAEVRMKGAITVLEDDLAGIRTGRASPALVEKLMVDYYGVPTPLQKLATIGIPEPQMLVIRPYDPSATEAVERAILTSELGLTPISDSKMIRLSIPPLTEERRHELVRMVQKRLEEAKVAIRNVRRDVLADLREFQDEKMISEDDFFRAKEDLQTLTDAYNEKVVAIGERKEQEIIEV
jgi:ribosome recycling factor